MGRATSCDKCLRLVFGQIRLVEFGVYCMQVAAYKVVFLW